MAKKKGDGTPKVNLREQIVKKIAEAMSVNQSPWRQSWAVSGGLPRNFISGKPYNGINILILQLGAEEHDFHSKYWGTMRQWNDIGAYITPKPEGVKYWGSFIIFFSLIEDKEAEEKTGKKKKKPMSRFYTVFNVDQVQPPDIEILSTKSIVELNKLAMKLMKKTYPERANRKHVATAIHNAVKEKLESFKPKVKVVNQEPDFAPAEELLAATEAKLRHRGDKAFYRKSTDTVVLPPKVSFKNMSHYYETAFHELVHWSMVEKRLNLEKEEPYAYNELVAEIGACFLAAEVGVPLAAELLLPESQKYLKTWLDRMGGDVKFIFDAAKAASKACDYLLGFVKKETVPI